MRTLEPMPKCAINAKPLTIVMFPRQAAPSKASRVTVMKYLSQVAALAFTGFATAAHAVPVEKRDFFPGNPDDLPCAVRIVFESSATGPDYAVWDEIRSYLAVSKDIQRAEAFGWRKEGEFILCLHIEEPEIIPKVFAEIKALTPKIPNGTSGPTSAALGSPYRR